MKEEGNSLRQFPEKSRWRRWGFRAVAWVLVFAFLAPMCGRGFVYAAELPEGGLCVHHPVHTQACGYAEAREASPCSHVHDETCGGLTPAGTEEGETPAAPEEPAGPESPAVPDIPEEPGEPGEPGMPDGPADPGTPPACNHVHDENCGYAEAQEARPCGYLCPLCLTGWQWNGGEDLLVWNEDAGAWGLGIPGASAEAPVTQEMLAELLPASITASTKAGTEAVVDLVWDFSQFPASAYQGAYQLTASLTGEYALTETAPKLEVLVALGGGETYEDTRGCYPGPVNQVPTNTDGKTHKFVNDWKYVIPTGGAAIENNDSKSSYAYSTSLAFPLSAFSDQQGLIAAITAALPKQIYGSGSNSENKLVDAGFIYENAPATPPKDWTPIWGYVNITWNVEDVIKNSGWPIQDGTKLTFYAEPVSNDGYLLRINTNDAGYPDQVDDIIKDRADTAEAYDVLNLTVTIRDLNPAAHTVDSADPENVKVNLFDY